MKRCVYLLILIALGLLATKPLSAQGFLVRDIAWKYTPAGAFPAGGATVTVCTSGATSAPCLPHATVFSDAALTLPVSNPLAQCVTSPQIGCIDPFGNYSFYVAPGTYSLTITGAGLLPSGPNLMTLPCVLLAPSCAAGGGSLPALPANSLQKYLAGILGSTPEISTGSLFTIGEDASTCGPNPYFDIRCYGGYVGLSNAPTSMSCSMNVGSTTLSCSSNPDFANGHGVVIPLAGGSPATLPAVPGVSSVTPVGVINGGTTYTYQFVLEDYFGGLTAAGSSGSTVAGATTLGTNTVVITGVVRSKATGLDTFTCSGNCNIGVNSQIQISGFASGGNSNVNGTVIVNSTPTAGTFTVREDGLPDYTESVSALASVKACNQVAPSGVLAVESKILRTWIYRNGARVGVSPGQDPFFIDCGQGVTGVPAYVPATPPGAPQVGYLVSTIVSGGGTNVMTLANAAVTSTPGNVTVIHDNASALKASFAAALATKGGVVRIPIIAAGGFSVFPFNSTTDLTTISNPTDSHVRIELANVLLNQPLIPQRFTEILGLPQSETSFEHVPLGVISGSAHPLILNNGFSIGGIAIERIKFVCLATGQTSMLMDEAVGSGGRVGFNLTDNGYCGNSASALVIKGGFDFWFTRGVCGVAGGTWEAPPCIQFTNGSTYLTGGTASQVPGLIFFEKPNFQGGTAIQIDNVPNPILSVGGGNISVNGGLHESNAGAFLRIFLANGTFGYGADLEEVSMADQANGLHQPLLEMTGTTNFPNIVLERNIAAGANLAGAGANPLILGGGSTAAAICIGNAFSGSGCGPTPFRNIQSGLIDTEDGGVVGAQNGGSMGYLMVTPNAPASCVVSAGGAVPITIGLQYFISATDRTPVSFTPFTGSTLLGTGCTVTTSGGNQTVTVMRPALPVGATGWLVWRGIGGGIGEANMPGTCATPIPVATTTYVDTSSFGCGTSAPPYTTALTTGIDSVGLHTGQITLSNEILTAAPRSEQNVFLPGALTSTWTGAIWTTDKAITVTRIQVQVKTAPVTCSPNAVVRFTDGVTPVDTTIAAAANDSGAISQNYASGAALSVSVQTAAAGCGANPTDANVVVQYRMQ